MSISRIKTKDTVIVIAGASTGKTGTVLRIDRVKGKAIVEGLNMHKKTIRRSQKVPDGAIIDKEGWINLSNLMPYDPKLKKGVRIARVKDGDTFVREAKGSGHRFA